MNTCCHLNICYLQLIQSKALNLSKRTKSILHPFGLLSIVYVVWYGRAQVWYGFKSFETVFALLIASYVFVLFIALAFLKIDLHQSLKVMLRTGDNALYIYGAILAVSYHVLIVAFGFATGGTVEVTEWLSLKGYEIRGPLTSAGFHPVFGFCLYWCIRGRSSL